MNNISFQVDGKEIANVEIGQGVLLEAMKIALTKDDPTTAAWILQLMNNALDYRLRAESATAAQVQADAAAQVVLNSALAETETNLIPASQVVIEEPPAPSPPIMVQP